MGFLESLNDALQNVESTEKESDLLVGRIRSEIEFAQEFVDLYPGKASEWQPLVVEAAELVASKLASGGTAGLKSIVKEAEEILAPIGKAAKDYTIYCVGHAHIDMNWLWDWPETVSTTRDTFTTIDRLMDEFPEFHFSQSQASTYQAMEDYSPEIFETIKRRMKEGRWEPTASMWVEGDKNLASGEILCRHLLYTRRYMKEKFGLPYDAIKIDWEPDTFGHAATIPSILSRGGVRRYYRCRPSPVEHALSWWEGPDGSRVLVFSEKTWYINPITPKMGHHMVNFCKETGLKCYLFVYGVGDHGGGPTRRDLVRAVDISTWPVFPNVKLSTTDAFFNAVEKEDLTSLPVHKDEINCVFEGCYTSESHVKHANRISENILPEVESVSLIAGAASGYKYRADEIKNAWYMAMFNQFHDILPGSGVRGTYDYAQGQFQKIRATAESIRTDALRKLASAVDTSAASGIEPAAGSLGATIGDGTGAGVGNGKYPGGVTAYASTAVSAEPFMIFNQMPFKRSEVVIATVWNKKLPKDKITVRDDSGNVASGQVLETGNYWGHDFTAIAFSAKDIPAMGYRIYTIDKALTPAAASEEVKMVSPGVMENEFLKVEIDQPSGAIKSLIDKETGYEFVPEGELAGVLEYYQEVPHDMTAWEIGQTQRLKKLSDDGVFKVVQKGPYRAAVKTSRKVNDSCITVEIGLNAGSRMIDFKVTADWIERGTKETGVPMLRIAFPSKIENAKGTYEIPFGSIERPSNGQEVPALKWADLSGDCVGKKGSCGITMVNADKYGHNADKNTLRLTLIRSSYDPDPLPEIGHHEIILGIAPHDGPCSTPDAARAAASFGLPMSVVSTSIHKGKLPGSKGFAEVFTPNIMLTCLKKAEDSESIVVRVYEMEGVETEAKIKISDIVKPNAPAVEVDMMEQALEHSTARMEGDTLIVRVPAHGIASVAVG
ncbi:MAG: glycoside hydrolase family 38 C-terminal domain-containing protein [Armatimonadota bacterium]